MHRHLLLLSLCLLAGLPGYSQSLDTQQSAFLTLINNYRGQNGVGPLQVSSTLQNSSTWMSTDMAAKNYFSHTDSLGRDPFVRMTAFGYTYYPEGENIAAGYSDAQNTFTQWQNACDPNASGACTYAHRLNMLNGSYKAIGIGRVYGSGSSYGWYWTTDFGGYVDHPLSTGGGAASGTASFLKQDSTTLGNWKGAYGADGSNVLGDTAAYPGYAAVTPAGQQSWTWTSSSTDIRALQKAYASDRVAATWYSSNTFTIDVNITDGNTHQVALYCLDWDYLGRAQTVNVLNSSGAVLDSRSISGFSNGVYLVWNLSGHVTFQVTRTGGQNTVVSGIFFGGAPPSAAATASFVQMDSSTIGNWKGTYGAAGYNVLGDAAAYPAFATVTPAAQQFWTWTSSTTDARALQKASAGDRVAATWYSGGTFTIDVNLTDGKTHQVALYCLDWDFLSRAQTIKVVNSSGAVLDSRSISGFTNGAYLVWNISGHVTFQITRTGGQNAVVSGVFFNN